MSKKTANEYAREWEKKKKEQGWKRFNLFLPMELITELREYIRQWKFKNPNFWRNL